jgi:tRNA 2-thiouridine synthesizing protein E
VELKMVTDTMPFETEIPRRGDEARTEALHEKIDRLTETVARLDRRREELEELIEDLMPAVNGAALLARDRLDEYERTGTWAGARAAIGAAETAAATVDPADLAALGAGAGDLVHALRVLADPQVTALADRVVTELHEARHGPAPSLWSLLRKARAPRVRRGMGVSLAVLEALGEGTSTRATAPNVVVGRPSPRTQPRTARAHAPSTPMTAAPTSVVVGGVPLDLDPDGSLVDPGAWTREVAEAFASAAGIALGDEHWRVIEFVRDDWARNGGAPGIRRIVAETGTTQKDLYRLFPGGPGVLAARISGLPKPKTCV